MGGYEAAGDMPAVKGLQVAANYLAERTRHAFEHAQICWSASLGLYSQGGEIPDPPDPDDYFDD